MRQNHHHKPVQYADSNNKQHQQSCNGEHCIAGGFSNG